MSASIGIALTHRSSDRASDLLRDADAAMYRAKRRGGARYELFDEAMHTQAVTRLLTERALRQSLEHDELRVLFQPEFDLRTGERVAVEALLRWEHPVRGLVPPGDFLVVAEETGLIVPIGDWVLDEVVRRAPGVRHIGGDDALPISMNVSARQLLQADFAERVRRTLSARDLDPALAVPRDRRARAARRPRLDPRRGARAEEPRACGSRSTTSAPAGRRSPTSAASRSTS